MGVALPVDFDEHRECPDGAAVTWEFETKHDHGFGGSRKLDGAASDLPCGPAAQWGERAVLHGIEGSNKRSLARAG
eukprot:1931257-Prymnesium_polylepis.1